MTRLEAFEAKVMDGENSMYSDWIDVFGPDSFDLAASAFSGSLDAAKALHDAVVPECTASIGQNIHHKFWRVFVTHIDANGAAHDSSANHNTNPARAWLLAIIRALIIEEKSK